MTELQFAMLWFVGGFIQAVLTARYWEVDKPDDAFWCVVVLTLITPFVTACWIMYAIVKGNSGLSAWVPRYFSGVNSIGQPSAWMNGATSWTIDCKAGWDECRRPTAEELNRA